MAHPRTRVLRWVLNRLGYDLRRLQKSRFAGSEGDAAIPGGPPADGLEGFEDVIPRPVDTLDIYVRTCARVEVFGQEGRKRIVDVPKCELILRCLNSLIRSIVHAEREGLATDMTLTLLDDHSEAACVERMSALLRKAPCATRVKALEETGNGPSLRAMYEEARATARDLIYFLEDDYLHAPEAIFEIVRSYERLASMLERDVVLFPVDYTDRYRVLHMSHVLLGSHRHWRTVKHTTGTNVASRAILLKYWDRYVALGELGVVPGVSETTTINRIYEEVPCLAPLASLVVHLQFQDHVSPFVDWRRWWAEAAPDEPEGTGPVRPGGSDRPG